MRSALAEGHGLAASGPFGGRAGSARAVRLLAAVGLLGVVLVIVALVDQRAASARDLPRAPAGGSVLPAARPGDPVAPAGPVGPLAGIAQARVADLGPGLAGRGGWGREPLQPAAGGLERLPGYPDRSGMPASGRALLEPPHLGEAWRPGAPTVARQPDVPLADGDDTAPDAVASSSRTPTAVGVTLAAAERQTPGRVTAAQPPPWGRDKVSELRSFLEQCVSDLTGLLGSPKDPELAGLAADAGKVAASAREHANAANQHALYYHTLVTAPPEARAELALAAGDLLRLSGVAVTAAGVLERQAAKLRGDAQGAADIVDIARAQVERQAAAPPSTPRPIGPGPAGSELAPVPAIVDPLAWKAETLAKATRDTAEQFIKDPWSSEFRMQRASQLGKAVRDAVNEANRIQARGAGQRDRFLAVARDAADRLQEQADYAQGTAAFLDKTGWLLRDTAGGSAQSAAGIQDSVRQLSSQPGNQQGPDTVPEAAPGGRLPGVLDARAVDVDAATGDHLAAGERATASGTDSSATFPGASSPLLDNGVFADALVDWPVVTDVG